MSRIENDVKLGLDESLDEYVARLEPDFSEYRIIKQSVDARRSRRAHFVYSIEIFGADEKPGNKNFELEKVTRSKSSFSVDKKPLIIGSGPAGLFAAIRFVERGIPCILLERGSNAKDRLKKINRHWRYGELDSDDNVCFGEGGAGLYSDGKLITRIKSPHIPYVLNRLVHFGAPAEIEYLSNPHVGSDRIRRIIPTIRQYLLENGCEIYFNHKVTDFISNAKTNSHAINGVKCHNGKIFHSPHVVLATGHSAEDVFEILERHEVKMEPKPFAMGLRIEHPQSLINKIQYRDDFDHPKLGAANYKITHHNKETQIGVYSFCMCPGGYTINASTSSSGLVCNGMSNYNRNSPFANSAIVVSVKDKDDSLYSGLEYRKKLESKALISVSDSGGIRPLAAQRVTDFLNKRGGETRPTSSPSGVFASRLDQILPIELYEPLCNALESFEKKMPGFIGEEAQFHGVESRTSCPLRVPRNKDTLESISHQGLYPTGEGAGFAGGITSAAVDGVRVADSITERISSRKMCHS